MRVDLHVHTYHSGMCDVPGLQNLCRESYSPPLAVYRKLKELGMNLVTVTDHDSIEASEELRSYPDFFLSEEVTCRLPNGNTLHVGVYDISDRQHLEIQRRCHDLPRLLAYLDEQQLFYAVNHIFSSMTGRRDEKDFRWCQSAFPAFEALNGHVLNRNNRQANWLARQARKITLGGSDGHTLFSLGSAYTEVPGARGKADFFEGLRNGKGVVRGQAGNSVRLTLDLELIALGAMKEKPLLWLLSPLALVGLPLFAVGFCLWEASFVLRWKHKLSQSARTGARFGPIVTRLSPEGRQA